MISAGNEVGGTNTIALSEFTATCERTPVFFLVIFVVFP